MLKDDLESYAETLRDEHEKTGMLYLLGRDYVNKCADIRKLTGEIAYRENINSILESQIERLKKRESELVEELREKDNRISCLEVDIQDHPIDLPDLQREIENLKSEIEFRDKQIAGQRSNIEKLMGKEDEYRTSLQEMVSENTNLRMSIEKLEGVVESQSKRLAEHAALIKVLNYQLESQEPKPSEGIGDLIAYRQFVLSEYPDAEACFSRSDGKQTWSITPGTGAPDLTIGNLSSEEEAWEQVAMRLGFDGQ